jgi:3-oxoacyl-[acyl-carrier protein] reductase
MTSVTGTRALVTGAASGIGRAIALELARRGVDLHLLDRDAGKLGGVAREAEALGRSVTQIICDLADAEAVSAAVQTVLARGGLLNILVNSAGVAYYGATDEMTDDQWRCVLHVNLEAPVRLIRKLLPTLLAQKEAHIVNVCSIAGLVAGKGAAAYQASKFGLVGFSQSLRLEYAGTRLGVTALCPGFVTTPLFDQVAQPRPNRPLPLPPGWMWTSPEVVARRAIRAILKNQGLVVITPTARFLWAMERFFPRWWDYVKREGWRR